MNANGAFYRKEHSDRKDGRGLETRIQTRRELHE